MMIALIKIALINRIQRQRCGSVVERRAAKLGYAGSSPVVGSLRPSLGRLSGAAEKVIIIFTERIPKGIILYFPKRPPDSSVSAPSRHPPNSPAVPIWTRHPQASYLGCHYRGR